MSESKGTSHRECWWWKGEGLVLANTLESGFIITFLVNHKLNCFRPEFLVSRGEPVQFSLVYQSHSLAFIQWRIFLAMAPKSKTSDCIALQGWGYRKSQRKGSVGANNERAGGGAQQTPVSQLGAEELGQSVRTHRIGECRHLTQS